MRSRFFSADPEAGITRFWHYDDDSDTATIETQFDVTELVEQNKAAFNSVDERARYGELTRVASFPLTIYFELKRKGILNDPVALRKWLNDRDNNVFRTRPGRV